MKKKKHISLIGWLFYGVSIAVFTLGFIGLFSRDFGFEMPILSQYYPIFDKHTVSTPGWASPGHTTEVVVGHHWVFLICLGISIVLAIIGKSINSLIYYLVVTRKREKAAAKRRAEERKERQARARTASGGGYGNPAKKFHKESKNSDKHEVAPEEQKAKEQDNPETAKVNDDSVAKSLANETAPNSLPSSPSLSSSPAPKTKAQAKTQKHAEKKESEPKPEPKGHHKSFAELTKSVSDIIQ